MRTGGGSKWGQRGVRGRILRSDPQDGHTVSPRPWLKRGWAGARWGGRRSGTSIARNAVGTDQREPPDASRPVCRNPARRRGHTNNSNIRPALGMEKKKIKKIVGGFPKAAVSRSTRENPYPAQALAARLPGRLSGGYRFSNSNSLVLRIAGKSLKIGS